MDTETLFMPFYAFYLALENAEWGVFENCCVRDWLAL